MKHVSRVVEQGEQEGQVFTIDEWRIIKPRDRSKKNFFYSYETAKDALVAAQTGEIPKKGVEEFVKYGQMIQRNDLLNYFQRRSECESQQYDAVEDERPDDDFHVCFACEQLSLQPRCCSQHPREPFCFDLKCVLSRLWTDIHNIVLREWAAFYGNRDPLDIDGLVLTDLPSEQDPEHYGWFTLEQCLDLADNQYCY